MTDLPAIDPAWAWILAGLILMGGELALPGIFLVWLGLAAFLTGLVEFAFVLPWQGQFPLFAALAVISVGLAAWRQKAHVPVLNLGAHRLIGREILLDAPIVSGSGSARIDDTLWRVTGPDAQVGTRMRVTSVEGTVLVVSPI